MRILNLFPRFTGLYGGERACMELSNALCARGHQVGVLTDRLPEDCRSGFSTPVQLQSRERKTSRFGGASWRKARDLYLAPASLGWQVDRTGEWDAVIFHAPQSLPALACYRGPAATVWMAYEPARFLYDLRDETLAEAGLARPLLAAAFGAYRRFDTWAVRRAQAVVALTSWSARWLADTYDLPPVAVATPGVDCARFRPDLDSASAAARLGLGPGHQVILCVGKLHVRKRFDLALASFAEAAKENPLLRLVIVGEGPESERLRVLAGRPGLLSRVTFAGRLSEADLAALHARADIHLCTAKAEPFGLTVLEAAASGTPVVTVDEGGPAELVIHERTGLRTAATATALGRAITRLAADAELRERMGAAARERALGYTWEAYAEAVENVCWESVEKVPAGMPVGAYP